MLALKVWCLSAAGSVAPVCGEAGGIEQAAPHVQSFQLQGWPLGCMSPSLLGTILPSCCQHHPSCALQEQPAVACWLLEPYRRLTARSCLVTLLCLRWSCRCCCRLPGSRAWGVRPRGKDDGKTFCH